MRAVPKVRSQGKSEEMPELIGGERRARRRYSLGLQVRWHVLRRNKLLDSGAGRTVNLSSRGILLETGGPLPVGMKVYLSISWPVLLHNEARMQLRVEGRIVRSDGFRVAVETEQYEFHTAGAPRYLGAPQAASAAASEAWDLPSAVF